MDIDWDKVVNTNEIIDYVMPKYKKMNWIDDIYNTLYREPKVAKNQTLLKNYIFLKNETLPKKQRLPKNQRLPKKQRFQTKSRDKQSLPNKQSLPKVNDEVSSDEELTSNEELSSEEERSDDIASSKGPSEHLLKCFKASKSKALTLSASKSKALTSSALKSKASTSKTLKVSTPKPLTFSGYRKIAMRGCVLFFKALDAPIEQSPFPRATKVTDVGSCSKKRRPKAYGSEPIVNLLHSFLNLGRACNWLTLSNREMDFRSFMMQEIDGEFKFLLEGCIDDSQCSPSLKSVNNESSVIGVKPLTFVHPLNFVKDVVDSDDASARDNKNPLVGTSLPPLPEAGMKLRSLSKRKLPSRVGDSLLKFPLAKEVKDSTDCHWVVAHVTLPSWKKHLRQISIKQLCDIHDRAYMRQVVLDNVLNSRTQELIYALYKATALCDAIRARELEKDRAYAELERKCNEALLDLDKNHLFADRWTEIETLQGRVDGLHSECTRIHDKASVVARVVPGSATKLICSDEMCMLVAKHVKASIIYGRCTAFKEVAKLKEPFVMEKMAGYRLSSKQEYDQASDDLANASYPFLSKYVNDPYASLEQPLSMKPESLCSKPSYVKAK
nr:hypothetical protein [Tanacetum cinerariifolium]